MHLLDDETKLQIAMYYAIGAHDGVGQKRKYSGEPYWVHPKAVADYVAAYGGTVEMVMAAYLHDVVEDTVATNDDIRKLFGNDVANLVYWVTNASKCSDGARSTRKAIDREHIWKGPVQAQIIKIADMLDNMPCIIVNDPKFAERYVEEKYTLLMGMSGVVKDLPIWRRAYKIVEDYLWVDC